MRNQTNLLLVAATSFACGFQDPVTDEVGEAEYCEDVAEWEGDWSELELDVIEKINVRRGEGGECDEKEVGVAFALELSPELRCAARKQSRDMARLGELTHVGVDGSEFIDRALDAGYEGIPRTEILAVGYTSSEEVFEQWAASEDHCRALYAQDSDQIGAGVFKTQSTLWWVVTIGAYR